VFDLKKFFHILKKGKASALAKDTITTTIWGSIGKAVGFLVPFFIATWFGVTRHTDAFFYSYGIIIFLSGLIAPVLENITVPFIVEEKEKKGDVGGFVGRILAFTGVGLIILFSLIIPATKFLLPFITNFPDSDLQLVFVLIIEIAPLVILITFSSILAGSLNAYKKFKIPALSPAFRAIITILFIFSFKGILGVHAIAVGYVIGELLRVLILFIFINRFKLFSFHFYLNLNARIKELFKTASYQVIGMTTISMNLVIDRTMASWLEEGSVSILHYSNILYTIPITFLTIGLMPTLISYWSSDYYRSSSNLKLKMGIKKIALIAAFISIFLMIIFIIFSGFIVNLSFKRGEFDINFLPEIKRVWIFYLLGFSPSIVLRIFKQAHLTIRNTKFLMIAGLISVLPNVLLNYILMKYLEVSGIALATSINSFLWAVVYGIFFYKIVSKNNA